MPASAATGRNLWPECPATSGFCGHLFQFGFVLTAHAAARSVCANIADYAEIGDPEALPVFDREQLIDHKPAAGSWRAMQLPESSGQAAVVKLAHGIFITGHGLTKAVFGNEQPCLGCGCLRRLGGGRLDPASENLNLNSILGAGGGAVRGRGDQKARKANHRSP